MPLSTIVQRRRQGAAQGSGERQRGERGATVLEWALIAAVVVVAASIIAAVIFRIINNKSADLEDCANKPANVACAP